MGRDFPFSQESHFTNSKILPSLQEHHTKGIIPLQPLPLLEWAHSVFTRPSLTPINDFLHNKCIKNPLSKKFLICHLFPVRLF